jgi:tetratricopeptide (TPR) repeat protein
MGLFGIFNKKSTICPINPDNEAIIDVVTAIEEVMHIKKGDYENKTIDEYLTKPMDVSFGEGYDHSIEVNGKPLSYAISDVRYLSHDKKYDSSIEILSKIEKRISENLGKQVIIFHNGVTLTRFYTEMAEAYYSLGKYNEALEKLKIAFEINKKYSESNIGKEAAQEELENASRCASLVYFKKMDYKNSIRYSKDEIKVGEDYCPWGIAYLPRLLIGVSYLLLGNSREAKKYFIEVEKIDPKNETLKKRATVNKLLALSN